ncbi:MAG: CDP-alcohol phosphatidyltransferase family protein [Bacilli bacterium]|nr:CDP-alcohol phosphatidyltransferase family protein [Bacilli bacterium]
MKKENPAKKFEKCLDISDRWDLFFTERASYPLAVMFNKMGCSPNFVTILGGVFGVAGAVLFAFNNLVTTIIGIVMVILYAILDCADGQVARMSHKGSLFGRCVDGAVDSVVYIAIYLALGFRLMPQTIPFTDVVWSWWIFIPIVAIGAYFHTSQSRMADYYRNAHMYLSASERGNELSNSIDMQKIMDAEKKGSFKRFVYSTYTDYTKAQERATPKLQKLLGLIRENGGVIPVEVSSYYRRESNKIARLANSLVFNVRSYVLFALLLIGIEVWILPFIILVLEPIKVFLIVKYEKIAANATVIMEETLKNKETVDEKREEI